MHDRPPVRLPWSGKEVPHGAVEVNQCCNIACDACYKSKRAEQKTVEQVKEEIDLLCSLRRVSSITIAGGEPTMHPELPRIIAHIASKGVRPVMLSNGSLLDEEKLQSYRQAGLKRIFVHIDSRQRGRPDLSSDEPTNEELVELRQRYIALGKAAGIDMSPGITLYKDTLKDVPDLLEFCYRNPHVDTLLVTNFSSQLNVVHEGDGELDDGSLDIDNDQIARYLEEHCRIQPAWYIPSTHDDNRRAWILYITAITYDAHGNVELLHMDPRYPVALRLLPRLARWVYGRYLFEQRYTFVDTFAFVALYGLLSGSLRVAARSARFLWRSLGNRNARVFRGIFQQSPRRLASGDHETCRDCPDATIRDGRLVNLCLVDVLERPLEVSREPY